MAKPTPSNPHLSARNRPTDSPPSDAVTSVLRALAILDAFEVTDAQLGLADIARRTSLPKPSALRLARTLAVSGYLVAIEGGAWRLGPAAARLGARYQRAFDLRNLIEPALQRLAQKTKHGTSFFALENKQRVRLLRVLGADGFVSPTRVGEPLPLDKGAAGQVILAHADDAPGSAASSHAAIRRLGYHITVGEADASSASIAAPVFAATGKLLGAISIAAPAGANAARELARHADALVDAARQLSQAFAQADQRARTGVLAHGSWHPQ